MHDGPSDYPELIRNDPESEACCELMAAIIEDEIGARVSVEDLAVTPEATKRMAGLAADALLHRFIVRERRDDQRHYSRSRGWLRPRVRQHPLGAFAD